MTPDSVQIHVASHDRSASDAELERQVQGKHSDFVVEGPNEVLKLSLVRQEAADSSIEAKYLVEDVTLYELAIIVPSIDAFGRMFDNTEHNLTTGLKETQLLELLELLERTGWQLSEL